ncbi:MAG: ATP-binding cassette domain-containing protein [Deltaproteobacteria bacterium]|nr:ATP-binding cassette domain-containing protein [Deltaproteobacteria bacterium]
MIEVRNLSYRYEEGGSPVLRGMDLSIQEGEYVILVGPNGCGKTTLIRHFNALLRPSVGDVFVDGMNTKDRPVVPEIRQRVGMVFGNPDNQLVGMTVEEDVSFGPGNLNLPPREVRTRVAEALGAVGISRYAKAEPHLLSDGEKQLVALAGVLAMNPRTIVLDEPTAYLDPSAKARVIEILLRLHREGLTIVHVTHDPDDMVYADRVLVMQEGRVLCDEAPAGILARFRLLKEIGLAVPRVSELMWRLKDMGLPIDPLVCDVDEACRRIMGLLQARESGELLG